MRPERYRFRLPTILKSARGAAWLTESLAAELLEQRITVNAVLPSTIDTPPNRQAMPDADFSRWVTPESLADVIAFLASDSARDISGAKSFLGRALRTTLIVSTLTGIIVAVFAWPLSYLFTLNATVASVAALPLALHMTTLPIKGWAMVALAPIRAAGDTQFSMLVGVLCGALVLPLTWFGIERLHIGLYSVPMAWIVAWSARAALTAIKLRRGTWSEREPLAA